jgi:cysteinyl-tRNA synthetase
MRERSGAGEPSAGIAAAVGAARQKFVEALDDDLNTSAALAVLFDLVRSAYQLDEQRALSGGDARALLDFFEEVNRVLAVLRTQPEWLGEDIKKRIEERQAARRRRDFAEADRIRDSLLALGIQLEDTKEGVRWKRNR